MFTCSEYAIRRSDSIVIGAGVCRGGRIDFAIGIGPIGRARAARLPYGRITRGRLSYTEYAAGRGRGRLRATGYDGAVSRSPRQYGYRARRRVPRLTLAGPVAFGFADPGSLCGGSREPARAGRAARVVLVRPRASAAERR